MNAPVDVLAVMDGVRSLVNCAAVHYGEWCAAGVRGYEPMPYVVAEVAKVADARAAVAELVDKAETAAQILHNVIAARQIGEGYQSNLDDLNAALARVQGGAA